MAKKDDPSEIVAPYSNVIDFTAALHRQCKPPRPRGNKKLPPKPRKHKKHYYATGPEAERLKAQGKSKRAVDALEKDPTRSWDGSMAAALCGLTHLKGAEYILNRYNDKRYPEARALEAVLKGIIADIGTELDTRQGILLNLLRSKLIIVMQVNKYLETCETLIDHEKGQAKMVLDRTFPVYSKEINRILNELYASTKKQNKGFKSYEDLVKELEA